MTTIPKDPEYRNEGLPLRDIEDAYGGASPHPQQSAQYQWVNVFPHRCRKPKTGQMLSQTLRRTSLCSRAPRTLFLRGAIFLTFFIGRGFWLALEAPDRPTLFACSLSKHGRNTTSGSALDPPDVLVFVCLVQYFFLSPVPSEFWYRVRVLRVSPVTWRLIARTWYLVPSTWYRVRVLRVSPVTW